MTSPDRTALVVAYAFPPNAAVGSLRPVRWCRWLPRVSRWRCAVLTVADPPVRRDDALLARLPDDLPVIRTAAGEPWPALRRLAMPDPQVGWRRTLVPAGARAARDLGARVVIATAPPWSSLLGAARLADVARLPLVLDFRDPWTEIVRGPLPAWRRAWERWAERRVCARAAAVLSTSDTYTRNLRARCRGVPGERFLTLHNGYDEEVVDAAADPGVAPAGLTVVHLGSLYARRRPFAALAGMQRWLAAHPDRAAVFRLVFVGEIDRATREAVAAHDLAGVCEVTGHLPQTEAVSRCRAADLLLLAMGDTELTPPGWLPSKLFEYLAVGRPVLAHTVAGEAAALLRAANGANLVSGGDPGAFAAALEDHWQAKARAGGPVAHATEPAVLAPLRQASLARRLAGILDAAIGEAG